VYADGGKWHERDEEAGESIMIITNKGPQNVGQVQRQFKFGNIFLSPEEYQRENRTLSTCVQWRSMRPADRVRRSRRGPHNTSQ
jgi:hypothetical protein